MCPVDVTELPVIEDRYAVGGFLDGLLEGFELLAGVRAGIGRPVRPLYSQAPGPVISESVEGRSERGDDLFDNREVCLVEATGFRRPETEEPPVLCRS